MDDKMRWLAYLGRHDLVPQLLAMRWAARTRVDPVAQAIAYDDACIRRRYERGWGALLLICAVLSGGYFTLSELASTALFGDVTNQPSWFYAANLVSFVLGLVSILGGMWLVSSPITRLPAKGDAEAFAADLYSIEGWISPTNLISDWRVSHANMRKYAEELLYSQAARYEERRRDHKKAESDKLKAALLVGMGAATSELHTRLSILNRHQLASLDPDEYLAEARKRLGPEKEPPHIVPEVAPSDEGLAALAPMPDELPAQS